MTDPATEGAKAVQEVAKTSGKAIDAAREAGGFIARFIQSPLEQAAGIWTDKLKYVRWEQQVDLMNRANAKMAEVGLNEPYRPLPLKLAIPILQEGSMEDEDFLRDRWANLLVNAANGSSGVKVQPMFVSMLKDMTSLDIQNLIAIFAVPIPADAIDIYVWPGDLPTSARVMDTTTDKAEAAVNSMGEEVALSLANLMRLGCITTGLMYSGGRFDVGCLVVLPLGRAFIEACTLQGKRTDAKSGEGK
jgi:hypothetical protein